MLTGGEITAMACVLIVTGGLAAITGIIVHAVAKVKIARIQRGLEDGAQSGAAGEVRNGERKG